MTNRVQTRQRASVALVALCCVTVLGIALASYLGLTEQSMRLGNRAYAKDVSRHLAEMGLERALRSFSFSTFSGWTAAGTTATKTINISSANYGNSGITAAINIRVDHYNAGVWSAAPTYTTDSMVWYHGVWFQAKVGNSNRVPPNSTYWICAPAIWNSDANYSIGDIAVSGGVKYTCAVAHANQSPPNVTYWSTGGNVSAWSAATSYATDDVALAGGTLYRCVSANSNQSPPNVAYWMSAPVIYSEGVATLRDNGSAAIETQFHATVVPAALFPNALGASTLVSLPSTGSVDSYNSNFATQWSAGTIYSSGSVVYYTTNGFTYRYINVTASSGNVPTNATYWSKVMSGSSAIVAGGATTGTAVTVASARVNGYVSAPSASASPYAPQASFGTNAIVTSVLAPTVPSTKVDLARLSRSPYIPQFDIQAISTGTNINGTGVLANNATSLGGASLQVYNITGTTQGGSTLSGLVLTNAADIITINGPVILNVTGPLTIVSGKIVISSTGSLVINFTGLLQIGGANGIVNNTFDSKNCILNGSSTANTSSSHYYVATWPFYGVIYMPSAYFSTSSGVVTIYGAISARNAAFPTNGCVLHYDASLRTATFSGVDAPYAIAEWRELINATERVSLP